MSQSMPVIQVVCPSSVNNLVHVQMITMAVEEEEEEDFFKEAHLIVRWEVLGVDR